jgi:predicted dehydrogenase
MANKLKWGILGAGLLAEERIAPAILESCNSELIAAYGHTKDKVSRFAEKFHLPDWYDNLSEFLANPDIDIVYISTPNMYHYEDIMSAIAAKKHVFCEKPMTTSLDKAYKIKEACDKYQVKFGLAFMFPFHPLSVLAKKWLLDDRIGNVLFARANFVHDLPACEKINGWRFKPEISGGGTIIEVGCHCADILNFLLGKNVKQVSATVNRNRREEPSESVGIINLVYENNILGLISVSNNIPGAGPYGTNFEIHGTKASIIGIGNLNRNPSGKLILRDASGKEEITSLPDETDHLLYIDEIESFTSHVMYGSPLYSNIDNGIYNMEIIMSAYESAEQKKTVDLS